MIAALLPAAGHSRRMGRPKLTLCVAGKTVLEHVLTALRQGGVERVLVVVGPHVADLSAIATTCGAEVLVLPQATPDMRATVEAGLTFLEPGGPPADWLLVPADHPTLDATVVRQLIAARRQNPEAGILVPTWQGRRGHPTLIAWRHVAGLRAHPAGEGLNRYLRLHPDETIEVATASRSVVEDLDTPEDYARLLRSMPPPTADQS